MGKCPNFQNRRAAHKNAQCALTLKASSSLRHPFLKFVGNALKISETQFRHRYGSIGLVRPGNRNLAFSPPKLSVRAHILRSRVPCTNMIAYCTSARRWGFRVDIPSGLEQTDVMLGFTINSTVSQDWCRCHDQTSKCPLFIRRHCLCTFCVAISRPSTGR